MNEILLDLNREELIRANEENLAGWVPAFGALGRACTDAPRGVSWSITGYDFSLFNSIMEARLSPTEVEPAIQQILAEARQRHVPLLWWTGPSTRPLDLGESLKAHGFVFDEESPGMAVLLDQLVEKPAPKGLEVEEVTKEADLLLWSEVMAEGFGSPRENRKPVENWAMFLRQADHERVRAYLGRLDGQPVATSLLLLAAGVAGIYAVGTIPPARGMGIGRYLTQYPLMQARRWGYRAGILQASPMGFNVYRSLGFEENCKIVCYRWNPELNVIQNI